MAAKAIATDQHLTGVTLCSIGVFVLKAFLSDGVSGSLAGMARVQLQPSRLIHDYTVTGGTGGALLNAAVMGLLALLLVRVSRVMLSGPTLAAIFTIMGFSLFGKTPANTAPIVLGVWMAGRFAGKPFGNYLLMALYGTALGPLVSLFAAESGWPVAMAWPASIAAGVAAGFILPALSMAMLRMHEGYNLYNIGFTCGFFGLFAAALLAALKMETVPLLIWNDAVDPALRMLVPVVSILFILQGKRLDRRRAGVRLLRIMKMTGRLPTDFVTAVSPGAALVNAGLLGLAGTAYLLLIGADFNGPVLGGLLTLIGFATFGKHPRNCWPVAVGVIAATLLFGFSLTAPGPVLALLFGVTLAPLAGEFGPFVGMAAGFIHLVVVQRTAAWHGGLDLYNNGFAGGLTATLFAAVIQWRRSVQPAGTKRPTQE